MPELAYLFDARRARDPTGTAALRRAYRSEGKLRMRQARANMRQAIIDMDVLGLGAGNFNMMPRDARLRAFSDWLGAVVGRVLLSDSWQYRHIARAWRRGEEDAARELTTDVANASFAHVDELARIEMQGIAAAVAQKVAREAASVITTYPTRHTAWNRLAKAFDSVGPMRISALADVTAVKGYNGGKVAVYKTANVKRVGVVAEKKPGLPLHTHDVLPTVIEVVSALAVEAVRIEAERLQEQEETARQNYQEDPIEVGIHTAGDDRVCDECDDYAASAPYDISEVEDALPLHPNCRCTWFPWDDKRFSRDAYDPNEERDYHGRWTAGGGGEAEGGEGHPGKGYSASAKVINGVIHTGSVYDAQRALYENRKVELKHIREVSTLIDKLGETAKDMLEKGLKAPLFNLCNVSIKGTNLFCAESKGIPRVEMPVIRAKKTKEFVKYLKSQGYKTEKSTERADHLRSTQDEIDGVKVASNMLRIDKEGFYKRIIVSRDNYILDGHHTWAGQLGVDARDGTLKGDKNVRIVRVDISITKLLAEANTWTGGKGKKAAGQDASWESQPRAAPGEISAHGGEFAASGGGSAAGTAEMHALWHEAKAGKEGAIHQYAAVMQKRCDRIAKTMQVDPAKIKVVTGSTKTSGYGTTLASTDDHTGNVTMFARVCTPQAFAGTLVHELTHVKYKAFRNAYRKEKAEVDALLSHMGEAERAEVVNSDGTLKGELGAKYHVYNEFTSLWNIPELQKEGGVSDYSNHWWAQTHTGKNASSAVYETTAEMARIKYETGKLPGGPRHKALYAAMNGVWYTQRPPGFKMIDRETIEGRDATVAWLTAEFKPASRAGADLAKVIYDDGDVQWFALHEQPIADALDYNPDQPRAEPGVYSAHGGEFTSGGGGAGGGGSEGAAATYTREKQGAKAVGAKAVWKPSSSTGEHRERVEKIVNTPALRNSRFRYQVGKLIDEAKVHNTTYIPSLGSISTGEAVSLLQQKVGESFWHQAALKVKKMGGQNSETKKMFQQAKAHGYEVPPIEALKEIEPYLTKTASFTAQVKGKAEPAFTAPVKEQGPPLSAQIIAASVKPTATIPVATPAWTKIGPQAGSVSGGLYGDPSGKTWYVKTPKTEDHVNADLLANSLYKLAGVQVAHQIKTKLDGKPAVASLFVTGAKTMAQLDVEAEANVAMALRHDFAVDAWLGNRDVVGLEHDNVIANESGYGVTRIDFGASLMYRAQGEMKDFTEHVGEISSMRDPDINKNTAEVFGPMSNEEISLSIDKVLAIPPSTIMKEVAAHGFPPSLAETLMARRQFLANYKTFLASPAGAKLPPEPTKAQETKAAMEKSFGPTPEATEAWKPTYTPTAAELEKAKKTGEFYPKPTSQIGKALVEEWNKKWATKSDLTPKELNEKITEYKQTKANIASYEQTEAQAAAAKAAAEKAAAVKEMATQSAKLKAEKAAAAEKQKAEIANIGKELGVDPDDANTFQALVSLMSVESSAEQVLKQFKTFQKEGSFKGYPITPFEYGILRAYTGSAHRQVNKELRSGVWSARSYVFTNALNKALKKMPEYEGEVHRGTDVPVAEKQHYVDIGVGGVFEMRGFTSSSKPSGSKWGGDTKYYLKSKSGRDISSLSKIPSEAEVLFPARTFFRIDKIEGSPKGQMTIWASEAEVF